MEPDEALLSPTRPIPMPAARATASIEVRQVTKMFGGAAALDACSLTLEAGRVTGIIGPNGAGKTTLLNVISGLVSPSSGSVLFGGSSISGLPAHAIAARGLVRTFQIVRELANLTVLENLLLAPMHQAGESVTGALFRRRATAADDRRNAHEAKRLLGRVGLWQLADEPAGDLSGGQKKLLELARALMLKPTMILLDEPAAGVSPPLLDEIVRLISELKREGLSFGIVEHDMRLINEVCDHVHVLAEGRTLVSGTFAEVTADHRVVDAYLGIAA